MKREDEYRQLAKDVLRRASEEQSAQMKAQWQILGARYMELADQSKKSDDDLVVLPTLGGSWGTGSQ